MDDLYLSNAKNLSDHQALTCTIKISTKTMLMRTKTNTPL